MPVTSGNGFTCLLSCYSLLLLTGCVNTTQTWIPQHNEPNHQWRAMPEAGYSFNRIHIDDKGDAYVLSTGDVIMFRAPGKSWTRESCPAAEARFRDISGYGEEVWIVGDKGLLLYKKDPTSAWVQEKADTTSNNLLTVYAADHEVWAAGQGGALFHRTARGTWTRESTPLKDAAFSDIYIHQQQLWLTGTTGVILHRTADGQWIQEQLPGADMQASHLYGFKGDLWLVTDKGYILHKAGNSGWAIEHKQERDAELYTLYGYQQEVWAFGSKGLILHRGTDDHWRKEESNGEETYFFTVYGHEKEIWATGNTGIIVHRNAGGNWERQKTDLSGGLPLFALYGYNDELYAAGICETIVYKKGNKPWQTEPAIIEIENVPLTGIFSWEDDIWVTTNSGTFLHKKQNGTWQPEKTPVQGIKFKAIYGYKGDTWLIGSGNTILHRTKDEQWIKEEADAPYFEPEDIYGKDGSIWIAGNRGTLLHKKVTDKQWKKEDINTLDVYFTDIYGQNDDIWVTGGGGHILHKKGVNDWTKEKGIAGNTTLHSIKGRGDTMWAAGDEGTILQKQGNSEWKKEKGIPPDIHIDDLCLLENETWAICKSGILLHRVTNGKWEADKYDAVLLQHPILYKGFFIPAYKGFLYKSNEASNPLYIVKAGELSAITAAAVMNNELYCINSHAIFRMELSRRKHAVVSEAAYGLLSPLNTDKLKLEYKIIFPDTPAVYTDQKTWLSVSAKPFGEAPGVNDFFTEVSGSTSEILEQGPKGVTVRYIFEIGKNFRIVPGVQSANKLCVRVNMSSGDSSVIERFVIKDENGNPYLILKNEFWYENKKWIIPVLAVLLYYFSWFIIWWFYPLLFLNFYFSGFFRKLTTLPWPVFKYLPLADVLLPVKQLVQTRHILNAWMKQYRKPLAEKFSNSETAAFRQQYVALPLRMDDAVTGKLVDKPDERLAEELFTGKQTILQIVGPGGAGKTTLALAMGRWLVQDHGAAGRNSFARIPVLIETDTTDLLKTITESLIAWLHTEHFTPEFTRILLKRQRLVVIADALSERSPATQEYFARMHGQLPVNALIITTRHKIKLQVDSRALYPIPLSSENLVHFVTSILATYTRHPLKAHEQLEFAGKIISLTESSNQQPSVTPVLVKLMIENAMNDYANQNMSFQRMVYRLPASIPEVYFQYLIKVNPGNPAASNYLQEDCMLQLAGMLAKLSLGTSFIPRDFTKQAAMEMINRHFPELKQIDPVQRFIDNGILSQKRILNIVYLRFNIDSLAEYAGASRLYDEYHTDEAGLVAFIAQIDRLGDQVAGFREAFRQVMKYKRPMTYTS